MPKQPFEHVALDFITNLPISNGHDSILTIVDHFSKYLILIPCKIYINAAEVAKLFFDKVVCAFSMPAKIISDRDPQFQSLFW